MSTFNIESLIGRTVMTHGQAHTIESINGRWVRTVSATGHVANLARDVVVALAGATEEPAPAAGKAAPRRARTKAATTTAPRAPKALRSATRAPKARPEGDAVQRTMSEAFAARRESYERAEVAGRIHVDSGDALARALRGYSPEALVAVCAELLNDQSVYARWSHLNPGQRSMNARNRLRAAYRSGLIFPDDVVRALQAGSR